jgi:cytochrome c oxidase cbb3-type subunit 1
MTIGVVLYVASMWIAGVMQGLMWRATNADGTLTYSFIESMNATYPYWGIRFLGGVMIVSGMFVMAWNVYRTIGLRAPVLDVVIPPPAARPA